jgi:KUP system potassium uptake protein
METNNLGKSHVHGLSVIGLVVTLGIVFGDIGTSPLYVMKAIVSASNGITVDYILGALSCIIWTLTLQTTLKYVLITLRADNKGEGGILALYALIRRKKRRWTYLVAILGASTLIADGVITPSITVVSAIEGLVPIYKETPVIPIVIIILFLLFLFQQFGTHSIGKSYGPIMFVWFATLACLGIVNVIDAPIVLKALNPYYAITLIINHPHAILIMGAVFLCTTGAEALYSDLGHCGLKNIRLSWIFVKFSLITNYLGQGAWLLLQQKPIPEGTNPFFATMPEWFSIPGVILSAAAAIIASQALISGSFTIFSEAMSLNFWPRQKIEYPTNVKGQLYIPFVNWALFISCVAIVLFFQNSSNMEAAYGLSITITMLMTTILLMDYLRLSKISNIIIVCFGIVYILIEGSFLIANLFKFSHGGWLTVLLAGIIGIIMFVWYNARRLKNKHLNFVQLTDFYDLLVDLKNDSTVPKFATNLVFLSKADYSCDIEHKFIYSVINKQPKRADAYWILHINNVNDPNAFQYSFETLIPNTLYRVEIQLGFKVQPLINLYFKQIIEDLTITSQFDKLSFYPSLRKNNIPGEFKFIIIHRIQNYDFEFSFREKITMNLYGLFRYLGISDIRAYGLDTSNVVMEMVPLALPREYRNRIKLAPTPTCC